MEDFPGKLLSFLVNPVEHPCRILANLDGMFTSGKALSKHCLFPPFSFLESECADTSRIDLDLESWNRRKVHITGLDLSLIHI